MIGFQIGLLSIGFPDNVHSAYEGMHCLNLYEATTKDYLAEMAAND